MCSTNIFDYFAVPSGSAGQLPWDARALHRPHERFDLMLVPRAADWESDDDAARSLRRVEAEPWADSLLHHEGRVYLRLRDDWIEATGERLAADPPRLSDLAEGRRFVVQFLDPNATKALHVGHLRNLAVGNALAAALAQAGAEVERRSVVADAGRSVAEAMAGILEQRAAPDTAPQHEKSDHFVGRCYAAYVTSAALGAPEGAAPRDSATREITLRGDIADRLLASVLEGEPRARELWSKTRRWVMVGQRETLARLGIDFDSVFFESAFLEEAARIVADGLTGELLRRRQDGVVSYATGRSSFKDLPLTRADGAPTQHLRSTAYWMAVAPELQDKTSIWIGGDEWVGHASCIKQLMEAITPPGGGPVHPTIDLFHGMVSGEQKAVTSSNGGALLIDDLLDLLEQQLPAQLPDAAGSSLGDAAAWVALGHFLPRPLASAVDFSPATLLAARTSPGLDIARARARDDVAAASHGRPAQDPDYRFAVVQSELYRRHLRLVVERLDVSPLARYLMHLARWFLEGARSRAVTDAVHALLGRGMRGLGLVGA
jgi:arginyl-tRNA synthetase